MAQRVFLHIGASKTGTTYLQNLLFANRSALRAQGLLLPGDRVDHYRFMLAAVDRLDEVRRPRAAYTAFDRVVEETRAWPHDVLITNELLASASTEQAQRTFRSLAPAEVHLIYTARDLARTVTAEWQQSVKGGSALRLDAYVDAIVDETPASEKFRSLHIVEDVLQRWTRDVPPARVHVVTLPPTGAGPHVLWNRFASVLGVVPDSCTAPRKPANTSLGVVETELLRRVNARLDDVTDHGYHLREWMRRNFALGVLARRSNPQRFGLRAPQHAWTLERAQQIVDSLKSGGYDIIGDLDDLLPAATPFTTVHPDDLSESDVNAVAIETIVEVLLRQRRLGVRTRSGRPKPVTTPHSRAAGRRRAMDLAATVVSSARRRLRR